MTASQKCTVRLIKKRTKMEVPIDNRPGVIGTMNQKCLAVLGKKLLT